MKIWRCDAADIYITYGFLLYEKVQTHRSHSQKTFFFSVLLKCTIVSDIYEHVKKNTWIYLNFTHVSQKL